MSDRLLDNKVTLITGGASGIGRAAVVRFAQAGATLVVGDTNIIEGEKSVAMAVEQGVKAIFVPVDVGDDASVQNFVAQGVKAFGRIDCAFNNAGVVGTPGTRTADWAEADFDEVMRVNVKGTWLCMKYEIRQMLAQGSGGAIVNSSSSAGLVGGAGRSPYSASKHGIIGLSRSAALEYAVDQIRVNAICFGGVSTPMAERVRSSLQEAQLRERAARADKLRLSAEPEEAAGAVMWMLSEEARFMVGAAMVFDGGFTAA